MYPNVWYYIQQIEAELREIKRENQLLKEKLESIRPLQIGKINYKIQELHVETLSGSLNLGITAEGNIENLEKVVEQMIKDGNLQFDIGEKSSASDNDQSKNS